MKVNLDSAAESPNVSPGVSRALDSEEEKRFDPNFLAMGRWWDRPEVLHGSCCRGFDFHAMNQTPRGRHTLKKEPEKPAAGEQIELPEAS